MKKKTKIFITGLAFIASLTTMVSCQDISKDLEDLKVKVATLEATVQSIQAKIEEGAVITSVTPSNSGIVITLSNGNKYEITNGINGKDGANGKDGSVVTIGENGNWFIDGKDTDLAAQGKDGVPGAFYVPNHETGCFDLYTWDTEKGEYVLVPTQIPFIAPGTITAVYNRQTGVLILYGVEGGEGELGVVVIGGNSAGSITAVELFEYIPYTGAAGPGVPEGLTTVVEQTNTFGPNGEMVFNKNEFVQRPTDAITIRISPANYELKPEDISLINTASVIFDQVVAKVKRHSDVKTKATPNSGLWDVSFELKNYDKAAFDAAVEKKIDGVTEKVLFAIKAGEAVTDFDIAFQYVPFAPSKVMNVYIGGKTAANNIANYNNRPFGLASVSYAGAAVGGYEEMEWDGTLPATQVPATTAIKSGTGKNVNVSTVTAPVDNRGAQPVYKALLNEEISINIGTVIGGRFLPDNSVKGMYVTLDDQKNANEFGVSGWNAWKKYEPNINGLNTIVEGTSTTISINAPEANGDIIGFRVYSVNWDGTLTDPDGRAFYVQVGEAGSTWSTDIATTLSTPNDYLAIPIKSNVVSLNASKLAGVTSYTFNMDDTTTGIPPFNLEILGPNDAVLVTFIANTTGTYNSVATTATDIAGDPLGLEAASLIAAKVRTVPTSAANINELWKYKDGKTYKGTLTFKNNLGFAVATLKVSFTKSLPNGTPSGFSVKANQIDGGIYNCYLLPGVYTPAAIPSAATWTPDWATTAQTYGSMAMGDVFNFPTGHESKYKFTFTTSKDKDAQGNTSVYAIGNNPAAAVPVAAPLYVASKYIDNTTQHDTNVEFKYGDISSEQHNAVKEAYSVSDAVVTASGLADVYRDVISFKTVYSTIYNNTYSWDWYWGANTPATSTAAAVYAYNTVFAAQMAATTPKVTGPAAPAENEVPQIVYEEFDGQTINLQYVMGKSTRDSKYNSKLNPSYQSSLSLVSATLTSKSTGTVDYYNVTNAGWVLTFNKKSGTANPTADVPSVLTLKCKDMYNKDVIITLNVIVKKR